MGRRRRRAVVEVQIVIAAVNSFFRRPVRSHRLEHFLRRPQDVGMDSKSCSVRPSKRCLAGTIAVLVGASQGCYHYAPVPVTDLAPGVSVRMELSAVAVDRLRRGSDSVAKLLDGFNVSGTISRVAGDSLLVLVPTSYMEANVRLKTQEHPVALLRSDVERVRLRRLDRTRTTWIGVAAGAVAAGAVVYVLDHGGRSSGGTPKPADPPDSRSPVLP